MLARLHKVTICFMQLQQSVRSDEKDLYSCVDLVLPTKEKFA